MILVDSSAWIEYCRRGGSREVRDAVFSAIRDIELRHYGCFIRAEQRAIFHQIIGI